MRNRLLGLLGAALALAVAFAIRAVDDGALRQYSGTALYASMIYAGVYVLRPRTTPLVAGAAAIAWCWAMELAQLTGVPAELSSRSLLARYALGVKFDPVDLAWYPAGVVPLVLVHLLLARKFHGATWADGRAQR
ncbi:DUF2809 domain-containing protein [Dactylosporangium aurantiacum]|uniref:DUF2809 domain-containing protein n=1 Tax=Dactylosporangium aurantiacum TaxID=35754 RepID=A0A9Q9ILK3_9ACTN|nr:DUF2809 domain-containing protein [Dactylosporangium aurantiacum]MDG6105564.1 DUF2809 domain-containing protein [Dactylosporangium aurantiacum]UWZ57093.1 DUF2809 domain-containing protein [Dactylosporangium aurantiacum]